MKINLFDNDFRHIDFSIPGRKSKYIEFVRDELVWDGITFFTNELMFSEVVDRVKSTKKIGWILEPRSIKPHIYEHAPKIENKFDYIMTHDEKLLASNKYKFVPVGGCWIREENYNVFPKQKMVSIIASPKKQTDGHQLRHIIADRYSDKIDIFGQQYNPIDTKEEGLKDYKFSIVVENSSVKNYFTEKLLDCFAVGTIPIYWGCTNIDTYFDGNGILTFNTPAELNSIMASLDDQTYEKLLASAENNFKLFREYELTEDWIYENILKNMM